MYKGGMESLKRMNDSRWAVYIPNFPPEKAEAIRTIARSNRMSAGAYIGTLLDKELEKSTAETTSHPNSDSGEIRDGLPG